MGELITRFINEFGARYFVPFSSTHIYQRADSLWARKYGADLSDYAIGFNSRTCELLPAFIRYDLTKGRFEALDPPKRRSVPIDPKDCGDDWSEPLESSDADKITRYFKAISHLETFLDFVCVRVGGKERLVEFTRQRFNRGLTFEAPRKSLLIAIENEIFDDMLIGNFMKTIVHGEFSPQLLYPDFTHMWLNTPTMDWQNLRRS